jgi:SAM-dependent methyltransferase
MTTSPRNKCPLCLSSGAHDSLRGADDRRYSLCPRCFLIWADPEQHLARDAEQAHYRTHENSIENPGYVAFLRRVIDPMLPYLHPGMTGLDFGCGPGPTLSQILKQNGIACDDYDPIFAEIPLNPPYDFIFATECFEHFAAQADEIDRICSLLKPGGYLGVMTELWTAVDRFRTWYYTRDPTHVSFFHQKTFEHICDCWRFEPLYADDRRVQLLRYRPDYSSAAGC